MKKYISILFVSALAAFTLLSCEKEVDTYEPGTPDPENCYGVFFPAQENTGSHTYDPSMERRVNFTVARTKSNGAITVPYTVSVSEEGVFDFGEIVFADGQSETTLEVGFENAPEGKAVSFSLALEEDGTYVSQYITGDHGFDFSALIVEWLDFKDPNGNIATLHFYETQHWGEEHIVHMQYYEVDGVRYCRVLGDEECELGYEYENEMYCEGGAWGNGRDFDFIWYTNQNAAVEIGGEEVDCNIVLVPGFNLYYHSTYDADVAAYDWYSYFVHRGSAYSDGTLVADRTPEYFYSNLDYYPSYYDGNGGFYFDLYYYIDGLGGWSYEGEYETYALASGFVRTDYSVRLAAGLTEDGLTPITMTAGLDVSSVKYAVYEGELNSAQLANRAQEIIADKNAAVFDAFELNEDESAKEGTIGVSGTETGVYTLVVVPYDEKGTEHDFVSTTFTYVSPDSEVPVIISCGLELTGKYASEGYTKENSLEYYIYGQDITDVKIGVYKYVDLVSKGHDAIVKSLMSEKSADEEVVDAINHGGYVGLATGLVPGTEYYLFVWASNGYEATVIYSDPVSTEGDPLPIYMDYSVDDYYEDGEFASKEDVFGTWNYYGVDVYGTLGLREYLGQVVVSDSETETEGPDDYGYYDEYVYVDGLFGDISWLEDYEMSTEATVEMDVYAGIMYLFGDTTVQGDYSFYSGAKAIDGWGYTVDYASAFIPVADGYYAFVDCSRYAASYNFSGIGLATETAWISNIWDPLLVDPEKDDNGVAPEASVARAKSLMKKAIALHTENFVESPKGRIKSIIDTYRSLARNHFTPAEVKVEREPKAVNVNVVSLDKSRKVKTRMTKKAFTEPVQPIR